MREFQIILSLFLLILSFDLSAQDAKPMIYRINIKENIGSNTWIYLQNGLHHGSLTQ
ncbi:hypothetical protein [Proteiniphilum sp. X52]|uniref:hypothetical protein n=1 Tax=Proteiniphilum sp. X52 TaxID=2382159 RepID=UPI001623EF01|nr:hypothetical protein [Proteiniphilum sp. X52]